MEYFSREYNFQPLIFKGHVSFQGSSILTEGKFKKRKGTKKKHQHNGFFC